MADEIDWSAIEERHGPIAAPERNRIELDVLLRQTDGLVDQADSVERWGRATREEIAAASAAGMTHGDYMAALQGDPGER